LIYVATFLVTRLLSFKTSSTSLSLSSLAAIFTSQSNDFAFGLPIVDIIYFETHPEFLKYLYVIAPINVCILNPIAIIMLEADKRSDGARHGQADHVKK
jgi:predicted Kef-type K+ transport protein